MGNVPAGGENFPVIRGARPAQCLGSGASLHFSTGTIIAFPIVD
jgi:hypothetical protein